MNPTRFYAYIFFRVSPELIAEKKENPHVSSFFEKLKKEYDLQSPKDTLNLQDPDLTVLLTG